MSGKGREDFPPIADELRAAPKARPNIALKPRAIPEALIDDAARTVGQKWGSSTQLSASLPVSAQEPQEAVSPKPGRGEWINKRFECPVYLDEELALKAVTERSSMSYLILKALKNDGFNVHDEDLNRDRRKYRK